MADNSFAAIWRRFAFQLERHRFASAYGIILISSLFSLPALNAGMESDVKLYQGVADDLFDGKMPYRDRVLEYPPYAIPIFVLPRLLGDDNYLIGFMLFALLADWAVKLLLILLASPQNKGMRALLPVTIYCVSIPFLGFFNLQRYDIFPALICLLAVWLFCSGRQGLSGLAIAIGIGVKLYPILFVPPLFALAVRQKKWKPFALGLAGGLLPMALLGFYLPWWRFAAFHAQRGLQAESLYASIIWLMKLCGATQAEWVPSKDYLEVHGPLAAVVLPRSRLMFAGAVVLSTTLTTWAAARMSASLFVVDQSNAETHSKKHKDGVKTVTTANSESVISAAQIALLLFLPLLAFVAFNQVLSPQYLIWLLPLAALASANREWWIGMTIMLGTMLTPIIFPSWYGDYRSGLGTFETIVLILRNCLLVAVWSVLILQSFWVLIPSRTFRNGRSIN